MRGALADVVPDMTADHEVDVVVIGAGQAGLSTAYFLARAGFPRGDGFVLLDHGKRAGGAWQYRWPTLRLDKVHGIHDLPGMPLGEPDASRPVSEVGSEYFAAYERTFDLPVLRPVDVRAVRYDDNARLLVASPTETWSARAVVNATGTWDRPFWPHYPGRQTFAGEQLHTADYAGPARFAGKRVIVVGGGTSAVQLFTEIAEVAAEMTWVTRRRPEFRMGPFTRDDGRAAVAMVEEAVRAGRPPESVVRVTGLPLSEEVERARERGLLVRHPMFERIVPDGAVWPDGTEKSADVILWATGFRAAIDHLAPLGLREPGGGIRMAGTQAAAEPRLHLVGYGPSASTIGATRAGRTAAREIRALLG